MSGKGKAKKQKSNRPPSQGGKDTGKDKKEDFPIFLSFTKAQVSFIDAAGRLGDYLKDKFGQNVSIRYFERFLSEVPLLATPQKEALADLKVCTQYYAEYLEAKRARDAERQLFRSTRSVKTIDAGLVALQALVVEGVKDDTRSQTPNSTVSDSKESGTQDQSGLEL